MGWEETEKHLLSLTHQSLQSLCKQYSIPANKNHSQLARSLAMLLEKEKANSGPEMEKMNGSTQASPATSSAGLPNMKEASTCGQDNRKRGTYSDRDDEDRPHAKHKKGSDKQVDQTLTSDIGTSTSLPPVSDSNGKVDCFSSCSVQGTAHNRNSQTAPGFARRIPSAKLKTGNTVPAAPVNTISFIGTHPGSNGVVSESRSHKKVDANGIDKGNISCNEISANKKPPFQLFVMSDEGIDLCVDLSSTPGDWVDSFKGGVSIPPSIHHSETEKFSNTISSLRSKSDQNTVSSSDDIIMDVENKGPESKAACTNSSLGSTHGDNSRSGCHPPHKTAVNSRSSASTLVGTLAEISRSQEGVPVVHSSCLTSDVQNMSLDMMAGALGNNVLPQESVDVSEWSGRSHAPLPNASIQPAKEDTLSPGKTKVCVKTGCTQNVVVISDSDENSCPSSVGKQEMLDSTSGARLTCNSDTNELLKESVPIEAVPMEEDSSHGLAIDQLAKQTVSERPVTDAQSDASSADHAVAGNFNLADPTPSSVASDNAITLLASKHGSEAANSHASVDNGATCDPEELQGVSARNILFSLRSAAARQTKPSPVPRRSPRLVPQ